MIPVIDLFSGPDGLGEGFSSLTDNQGEPVFQTVLAVEKDSHAYQTLRLRLYVRKIINEDGTLPPVYLRYMRKRDQASFERLKDYAPEKWEEAEREALCVELKDGDNAVIDIAKKRLSEYSPDWQPNSESPLVIIGGPPCQAYSLVGRSRRAKEHEILESDPRQTLYKCYLAFIEELHPQVFVMENVKGLLSAQHDGGGVFARICNDMEQAGYSIHSLVEEDPKGPEDYVVKAERYGIPQSRHRVILLGIRQDLDLQTDTLSPRDSVTLRQALNGLPRIRSSFSTRNKNWREMNWSEYIDQAADKLLQEKECANLGDILLRVKHSHLPKVSEKNSIEVGGERDEREELYSRWYRERLGSSRILIDHKARAHLAADLDRYLFCSAYAEKNGVPAKLYDFPNRLLPKHNNIEAAKSIKTVEFSDRFRVQPYDKCSTTIMAHIAKDGHYYIHPDPEQCRSLTVREAARLQTFPDDYIFEGNRTSQYTQIGNAVPPLLAQQIAKIAASCFAIIARDFFDSSVIAD